jgi:hypothetical protein
MQIGGAVVLAVVTAILTGSAHGRPAGHDQLLPGMTTALGVIAGVSLLGLALTVVRLRSRRPQAITEELAPAS